MQSSSPGNLAGNVRLAIIFDQRNWRMSDGALLMLREAMTRLLKPDWKDVFNTPEVKASVRRIVGME